MTLVETSEAAPERPRVPLADRKAYLASLPWIRQPNTRDGEQRCKAYTRKHHRCTLRGQWQVTAMDVRDSGTYCWRHVFGVLYDTQREYERFLSWTKANPPYWMQEEDQS